MDQPARISPRLHALRLQQALGVAVRYALRLVAFGLPLLILYGLADLLFTLPPDARRVWNLMLPAVLAAGCLAGLRRPGSLRDLARRLDRIHQDPRRSLTCALDLESREEGGPFYHQLRHSALAEARERVDQVSAGSVIPVRALGALLLLALIGAGVVFTLVQRYPERSRTVAARIASPGADIAPWSPLEFHVTPDTPSVVYGQDLEVNLQLTGGEPKHPVLLRTRIAGKIRNTPGFREEAGHYSQRLEQVTEPLEFCFVVGRIRSPWMSVDVQLLPRVSGTGLQLTPPEYSGKPDRRLAFGERVIEGLPGTRIELTVQSNRPLSSGEVELRRADTAPRRIPADIDGKTAHFVWTLDEGAAVSVNVRDVQGNTMDRPLETHQRVIPDTEPDVVLTQPPRFMLATPGVSIPIRGVANDDVGVTEVRLVRGMPGFIDRPQTLREGAPQRRREINQTLDLASLGVRPGETLEVYLEAVDHRPENQGRAGVSGLSRIQIITEEEYALNLRRAEQLEGFRDRFRIASVAIQEAELRLRELATEVESSSATRESLRQAIDRAAAAQRKAEQVFSAMAEEFPAYDLEKNAQEELGNLRTHFKEQAEALENLDVDDMALDKKVQRLAGAHREQMEASEPTLAERERFLKLGNLLEQTAEYRQMVERQKLLVRWFERTAYVLPAEARDTLRQLGAHQEALREDLESWMEETRLRSEDLLPEDGRWREEVQALLNQLEQLDVDSLMRETSNAARNEANREALKRARQVLEALQLPEEDEQENEAGEGEGEENRFRQLCRGNMPGEGQGGDGGLSSSLRQLLQALRSRGSGSGQRRGGSGGGGIGGFDNDGYATQGSSPLHLPMQGPNRHRFDRPYGQSVDGFSNGSGGTGRGGRPAVSRGANAGGADQATGPADFMIERAPEQYRGAIKTFYDLTPERTP